MQNGLIRHITVKESTSIQWVRGSSLFLVFLSQYLVITVLFIVLLQLEQSLLSQKQMQLEADLAKKEKDRLEEMRRREQNRIMEVMILTVSGSCFIIMKNFFIRNKVLACMV